MATIFTRWIARRRERKERERIKAAPSPPKGTTATLVPSGDSGTKIVYLPSGGGGGTTTPTPTISPTGKVITTYPDIKLPTPTPTPTRDVKTQQTLRQQPTIEPYKEIKRDPSLYKRYYGTAYYKPQFGTVTDKGAYDPITYQKLQEDIVMKRQLEIGKIKYDYQKKINEEMAKDIEKTRDIYQGYVNKRTLSVKEAQKGYEKEVERIYKTKVDKLTPSIEREIGKAYERTRDIKGVYKTEIDIKRERRKIVKSIGADIVGGVVGGGAYFVGRGAIMATKAEDKLIVDPSRGYAPVKVKPTKESIIAATYIGLGAVGTVPKYRQLEKAIVRGELESLGRQPLKYGQLFFDRGKVGMAYLKGTREVGKLKQQVLVSGKVVKVGKRTVFMPLGEAEAVTTGELGWNILGGLKPTKMLASQRFFVTAQAKEIPIAKGVSIGISRGVTTPIAETSIFFKLPKMVKPKPTYYDIFGKEVGKKVALEEAEKVGKVIGKEWYKGKVIGGEKILSYDVFGSVKVGKDLYFGAVPKYDKGYLSYGLTKVIKVTKPEVKAIRGGIGKRSSKQYLEELYAPQVQIPKPTFRPRRPILKTDLIKPEIQEEIRELPYMVGGMGLKTLPKPSYVQPEIYEGQMLLPPTRLEGVIQPSFIEMREEQRFIQPQKEVLKTRQEFIQPLKEKLKMGLEIKSTQKFIQPIKEEIKETQLFKQALRLKQAEIQKQRLAQRERLAQIQKPRLQIGVKVKPTIPPFPFKLKDAISKVTKMVKERPEVFEAWGKRFGKEVKLGIFKTKPEAEKKLKKFLVKTLGAAGYLKKAGEKLKATEIELLKKKEFRPSKISEFLVVEKKEKRLRKATTGKDIQFFRGKPSKRRKKGKSLFGI